ncbi:hypothetical protein KG892_00875 [Vermiphilus pyriformis]|nr:MAG: hypothetical protein KG892_00875 [Vermiphilus pyriformis]
MHCQGIVAYARMVLDLACNHEVIMDRLHIPHEHASLKSLLESCRQVTYSLSPAGGEGREYARCPS